MDLKNDLEILKKILIKGKALSIYEITKALKWSPKFRKKNTRIIEEWIEAGELIRNKQGKISVPEKGGFVKGVFNVIQNRFAFVDTEDEGIFIPRSSFNSALDGDTVLIKIIKQKDSSKGKEGEVVSVITRAKDLVVGILDKTDTFGFVSPTHSFGKDIYIHSKNMKNAKDKELVVVKILFWGDENKKPEGQIIQILGNPFDTKNMIDALIIREKLSETFPAEVLSEMHNIIKAVSPDEVKERIDLTNLDIITIDGADAKDLDDAVYVEKLKNGNYRLIVSIADVSYYIPENSALDEEAFKRGNSVYLVDRVIPMFPKEISNGICSLNPHEPKLTFSCDMEIDIKGNVIDAKTYKSVISSVERMTYDDVNKIIKKDEEMTKKYAHIEDMIDLMLELSKIIRNKKYQRGSIDFDLPEIKPILNTEGKVDYIKAIDRGESERIIEDFMIAANESVATKLFWLEIPSIYRTHEKPDMERIKLLNETLYKFGYKIHNFEEIHPKQFQSIIEDSENKGTNVIVHKMILMSLKQARYTMDNSGHFGLASTCYTHFTSPIRRYADLIIHRILNSVLHGYPSSKKIAKLFKKLPAVSMHISKTERDAMKLEYESKKIKIVEYMMDKIGFEYKATIIGFSNRRVFFETEEHIECSWNVVEAKDYYEFDDKNYVMLNKYNEEEIYNIGDKINITIARASLIDLEIDAVPSDLILSKE